MKRSDFVKERVMCVSVGNNQKITIGKKYIVVDVFASEQYIRIINDDGEKALYFKHRFAPVIQPAF